MKTNNERVRDLEEYCSSSNESLSLEGIREKLALALFTSQSALSCSHFLHELCLHPNVTLEMVKVALQSSPDAAYFCTNRYDGGAFAAAEIKDYDGSEIRNANGRPQVDRCGKGTGLSYPIHVACANSHCAGAAVRLLVESNQSALEHFCLLEGGCSPLDEHEYDAGLAIHYYLARSSNVDLNTLKCLVEAHPRCLGEVGRKLPNAYHSIHVLAENTTVGENMDILRYLVNENPAILEMRDCNDALPIHRALENEYVTTEVASFLIEVWPDSVSQYDMRGDLPIRKLCSTERKSDMDELDILRMLIEKNPDSVRIPHPDDETCLVHLAAALQSTDFVKILVEAHPESTKERDEDLALPFHYACKYGSADTVKYLYEMYPGSIDARNCHGLGAIHMAATRTSDPALEALKFLLGIDPGGASRAARPDPHGDARGWRPDDPDREFKLCRYNLFLPLHYGAEAYGTKMNMGAIRYLFDIYPEALLLKTNSVRQDDLCWTFGNFAFTPEGVALKSGYLDAIVFLAHQLEALVNRDAPFPLHRAITDNRSLGVVKLFIAKWYRGELSVYDVKNNSPLHYACEKGRIDIVTFLLETQLMSGSEQNEDGKFPVELLLESSKYNNKDTVALTEAIWRLLVANPEVINIDHKGHPK